MAYFCPKYMRFDLKNTEELSEVDAKFEQTLTLRIEKWHEELGELSLEHPKVSKLYIDGLFLSKACTVSVRKFQRNYVP